MERQVGKGDSPGKGLRLEWQVLCQPIADRQSDDWHELERSPLLRLAKGEVRSRCAGGPPQAGPWGALVRIKRLKSRRRIPGDADCQLAFLNFAASSDPPVASPAL